MISQTEIKANTNYSLIISEEMLNRVDNWGDKTLQLDDIECDCRDEAIRHFSNVKNLLEFENEKERKIISAKFYFEDKNSDNSIFVHLNGDNEYNFQPRVTFKISGNDDFCNQFRDKIKREIKACRSWYWLIERLNIAHPIFALIFIIIGSYGTYSILFDSPESFLSQETNTRILYVFCFLFGGLISAIPLVFIEMLKQNLFPRMTFAIGFEKSRNKLLENIRWGVFVATLVSILGGIIVASVFL